MKPPPLPFNEQDRLKELFSLEVLDSASENQFEEIVQLAAHICGTPISLITLLDETRQWFKAKTGLDINETPRDVSFCAHAIADETDEVFVIENAKTDSRFQDNPLVIGSPNIHFYAGYPLKTSGGYKLGTLCVIDTKEKQLTNEQKTALELLAKQIVKELELQRANRELKRRNQMLQGILENMPVIAYRVNADGTIRESVGKGLSTLGFTDNELVGKNAFGILPHMKDTLREVLQTGKRDFISDGHRNGKDWYFEHYVFPDETNPGGIIGLARDITERIRIEQELKDAKESAERASRSKSRFLANMSHEIRTPISAILGFAQVLKRQSLSAESMEYLNYISSSGEMLLKLIGDVLDLTKVEEGKFELQEEPFHLKEVLASNLYPYKFRAHEKGLEYEMIFDDNLPDYVIGDAGKLSQIVINLIGNALKFTKQGGIKVGFSAEQTITPFQTAQLKVSVTDTGIGIPPEKIGSIFQSFTQADTSINREFGGSGLGLAIVKELVERMGGQLGVESHIYSSSSPSTGSTFWFTIPLKPANTPQTVKDAGGVGPLRINFEDKARILVVDDNEINQRLAMVMLKNMGCVVTVAGNGREAIDALKENDFHLVFMDVQMPLMNGYEATRYIRDHINDQIPVVGLSANVYKDDIERCYESGMSDYLGKPYTEKSLQEKIIKWIPLASSAQKTPAENTTTANGKLTDLSFLTQLFNGDEVSIKEMVTDFLDQQRQLFTQMSEALTGKDYKKLSAISHNMRSSVVAVGLDALREPLIALESLAQQGDSHASIQKKFEEVQQINQAATEELQASFQ